MTALLTLDMKSCVQLVVEKDPGVSEVAVEVFLNAPYTSYCAVESELRASIAMAAFACADSFNTGSWQPLYKGGSRFMVGGGILKSCR